MEILRQAETRLFFSMKESEFLDGTDSSEGLCLRCGVSRYGVEPDAEGYKCDSCGSNAVMGIEMALVIGRIRIEEG